VNWKGTLIDPQARLKPYLRLMALIALMGVVSALITFAFIFLVNQGIQLIWEQARLSLHFLSVRLAGCLLDCW
jgi:hypothetical protein